jgi:glutathione S-transferase
MHITLYHAPMSCSLASRLALVESSVPHDVVLIDTRAGEHRSESFRRINPLCRVPVIDVDGRKLRESSAILPLIADLAPDAGLLPSDPVGRATVQSWIGFLASTLHPCWSAMFHPERLTDDPAGIGSVRSAALTRLSDAFGFIEQELAGQDWLAGSMSICDFHLAVLSSWRAVPLVANRLPALPSIDALQARLFARPKLAPIVRADMELRARSNG